MSLLESESKQAVLKGLENMTYKEGLEELMVVLKEGNPIKSPEVLTLQKENACIVSMPMVVRKEINWSDKKNPTTKKSNNETH